MPITLDKLRRYTVARNFPPPTTLKRAIHRMGFVQADPIRAPARAQDLILRQRVKDYRAGDLERRYATLDIDEDVFVNYGFVSRSLQSLMHPRTTSSALGVFASDPRSGLTAEQAKLLLEFVRARGEAHPRQVEEHFAHGTVTNYWGGSSNATTHLLEVMHYRGLLRVARREKGIRIYRVSEWALTMRAAKDAYAFATKGSPTSSPGQIEANDRDARIDKLVDTVVRIYAPLPGASLSYYVRRLRHAVPQWTDELTNALQRAKARLAHANVEGLDWYWPKENAKPTALLESVRFLAPFDPLVHDRARFKLLWGWEYRFEAYTPAPKRKLGYYALPLLWRDRVIGWTNLAVKDSELLAQFGYVESQRHERAFKRELEAELERTRAFLDLARR